MPWRHIFPIEIAKSKTVDALRKSIKDGKGHAYQNIDADTFVLWEVSIPVNRSPTKNLSKFDFVDEGSMLSVNRLSKVLSDQSEDEHLRIVARASPAGELDDVSHD